MWSFNWRITLGNTSQCIPVYYNFDCRACNMYILVLVIPLCKLPYVLIRMCCERHGVINTNTMYSYSGTSTCILYIVVSLHMLYVQTYYEKTLNSNTMLNWFTIVMLIYWSIYILQYIYWSIIYIPSTVCKYQYSIYILSIYTGALCFGCCTML